MNTHTHIWSVLVGKLYWNFKLASLYGLGALVQATRLPMCLGACVLGCGFVVEICLNLCVLLEILVGKLWFFWIPCWIPCGILCFSCGKFVGILAAICKPNSLLRLVAEYPAQPQVPHKAQIMFQRASVPPNTHRNSYDFWMFLKCLNFVSGNCGLINTTPKFKNWKSNNPK